MVRHSSTVTFAGMTAALALALSGCGDSKESAPTPDDGDAGKGEQSQTEVYQFENLQTASSPEVFMSSGSNLTIQLSDELRKALPSDAALRVENFTITAKALESGMCRLGVDVKYTEGDAGDINLDDTDATTPEGVLAKKLFDHSTAPEIVSQSPDDDDMEPGTLYLSEDYSKAQYMEECSEGVDDHIFEVDFNYSKAPEGSSENAAFAQARIAVLKNDTGDGDGVSLAVNGLTSAEVSNSGGWEEPEGEGAA